MTIFVLLSLFLIVSDTLSSVRQAMDGETENQNHTVGDAASPDLV